MSLVNLSEKIIAVQLTNERGISLIYVSQSFRAGIYSKVLEWGAESNLQSPILISH